MKVKLLKKGLPSAKRLEFSDKRVADSLLEAHKNKKRPIVQKSFSSKKLNKLVPFALNMHIEGSYYIEDAYIDENTPMVYTGKCGHCKVTLAFCTTYETFKCPVCGVMLMI